MPTTSAYVPEAVVQTEAVNCGRAKCDSSLDFESEHSKSSETSEKSLSDSLPSSTLDFSYNPAKEKKSFLTKRPSIHQLDSFSNDQKAYYSDFYDSAEQIPAAKKCENFFMRSAYSKCSSESDIFKRSARRRFSFNPEAVRHADKQKWLSLSTFSLDDISSYDVFQDSFTDWNTSFGMRKFAQNSLCSEENMSTSSSHIYSSSDSLSSNSADGDYEKYLKKSIHDYFKNRVNRDSTSSLCTSHSSGSAMRSFPEEIADDSFETLANNDPPQILNSPANANWAVPLYSSLLNLKSTAAEQMLANLGFCDSLEIIPARFFPDKSKGENGTNKESSHERREPDLSENNTPDFLKERDEYTVSKGEEVDSNRVCTVGSNVVPLADSNMVHLVQNQMNTTSTSSNKTSSVDFEEINHSTVHVINNNKRVFYKQRSILDEIEEANRNSLSQTFENKPDKEKSPSNTTVLKKCDSNQVEVKCHQFDFENNTNFKRCENIQPLDKCLVENKKEIQIDTKYLYNSMIPNIKVSNQKPSTNVPKKIHENLEIDFLFRGSDQKSSEPVEPKAEINNESNLESCLKNMDDKFLKPHLLSISCNSSPAESPLTVIDLSFQDSKESIIANDTDNSNINTKQSSIDLYSDYTLNNSLLDNQFDENLTDNSNFQCIQEDLSDSNQPLSFFTKDSTSVSDENNSVTKENYSKDDENCCQEAKKLKPYLTFGPDVVTIHKNSSCANKEDLNKTDTSDRVYTSNFNMFIKGRSKKRVNLQNSKESKSSSSIIFSPVVINKIRFDRMVQDNDSERELADNEDRTESKVSNKNICNSSGPLTKRNSWLHDSLAKNKENNSLESASQRNENDSQRIKVTKANIIFKSESQIPWCGKVSNKVILKDIGNNQRKCQRQSTDRDKHRRDSWTQCNFQNYTKQRNLCDEDSIKLSEQNLYPQNSLVNPRHPTADLCTGSKENKVLLNNKSNPTRDKFQNNGHFNYGLKNFDKNMTALDFSTSFSKMSQTNSNCYKEKAVLSLHKASQTRACGLYPLCKNELNICANCLYHINWHYL